MKKLLLMSFLFLLTLALVACGGEGTDTTIDRGTEPPAEHVHAYVDDIIPATCVATGKVVSKCECGDISGETEIPLADHTASTLDCEQDTVCTVCNTVLAEKTGHIFTETTVVTAATCAASGKESGSCISCGKVVENEIPATGHIAGTDIKLSGSDFATTCTTCGQAIMLKADKTVFALSFDEDVATEAAKYDAGLSLFKPEGWNVEDGTLKVNNSGQVAYINVVDPAKLSELGTFMISFDFTSTKEGAETAKASVFSILNNFYDGKTNVGGTTGWGWIFKLNEEKNVISTVNDVTKFNDENSIAIERNVKYTVQAVVNPSAKGAQVFINGKYIGNGGQGAALSSAKPENFTLRFADGPECGYVFDNFAIVDLK